LAKNEVHVRILITGGAGYIGSVAVERAQAAGHDVIVVDNLWRGHRSAVPSDAQFHNCDLRDREGLGRILAEVKPDAIMHFAAATLVPESMDNPLLYFEINAVGSHNLISAAIAADVPRFVFSSTAAVYGDIDRDVITEDAPTDPINPYGRSKLMVEQMLAWHQQRYGLNVAIFRYFNVAGATEARGEDHTPETHLIPVALQVAQGKRGTFTVFGDDYDTRDGSCVRDFVHVMDLGDAHVLAADWLADNGWGVFNLGTTNGSSVQEIIRAVEEVTDQTLPVTVGPRRAGDPPRLIASAERARSVLGWNPTRSTVEQMVGSAWEWMERNPDGYGE
jgi:UDP-glucose 4-epimerase